MLIERGVELDMNHLFRELRTRWFAAKPKQKRIGTDLCNFLGIRKQLVSCYATGSDGRRPPLWAVVKLMTNLNLELRITGDGAVLTLRRGKGEDGPATRKGDVVIVWQETEQRLE